mmetsp:Transcript_21735/g.46543  ORF Transcript_21735/g.46543 Transcript_21735/m.46543 type:complete len:258 (-) Transcript_21735:127-900(-)
MSTRPSMSRNWASGILSQVLKSKVSQCGRSGRKVMSPHWGCAPQQPSTSGIHASPSRQASVEFSQQHTCRALPTSHSTSWPRPSQRESQGRSPSSGVGTEWFATSGYKRCPRAAVLVVCELLDMLRAATRDTTSVFTAGPGVVLSPVPSATKPMEKTSGEAVETGSPTFNWEASELSLSSSSGKQEKTSYCSAPATSTKGIQGASQRIGVLSQQSIRACSVPTGTEMDAQSSSTHWQQQIGNPFTIVAGCAVVVSLW